MDRFIDIYCERLGPGLWAEPINALTNGSFFIAAFFAFLLMRSLKLKDIGAIILITLVTLIGIGSSLFHTHATLWAQLTDVLPILFYQIAFLIFYTRRVMGGSWRLTLRLLALFILTIYAFGQLPSSWLNGSLGYAPAFIFLLGFAVWHWKNAVKEKELLFISALIFLLSLTFRSTDMMVCDSFPLGTHFMWHILNGAVLYASTRAYIVNRTTMVK